MKRTVKFVIIGMICLLLYAAFDDITTSTERSYVAEYGFIAFGILSLIVVLRT